MPMTEGIEQLAEQYHQLMIKLADEWVRYNLWTWQWWVNVGMLIIPWVLWVFIRDKKRTARYLCVAFAMIIITSLLNIIGESLGLWVYPYKLVPLIPPFFPWDFSVFPVATMITIQFKPVSNPYGKGAAFAVMGAFIFEPVMVLLGLYKEKGWSHFYSLPMYFLIYLLAHYISTWKTFDRIEHKRA